MNVVFLDTVGLLALWDEDDQWHADAERAFAELTQGRPTLITSSCVLLECGNAAARRPYRQAVSDLRQALASSGQLVEPTEDDVAQAWANYCQSAWAGPGIVDLISFQIMRRIGISRVFGNDRHFRAAGFETLF
jgi:predicted nucleic acid-binding protein